MGRTGRILAVALAATLLATVPLVLGTVTPAAAWPSATYLPEVNSGGQTRLAVGQDGTNLAVAYDRDDKVWFASVRVAETTTWTTPLPLTPPVGSGYPAVLDQAVTTDLTGVVVSYGISTGVSPDRVVVWRRPTAAPAATAWTAAALAFPQAGVVPAVAIRADGSVVAVWNDPATKQVKTARTAPGGSAWGATSNLGAAGEGGTPRLWTGRDGQVVALWFKPSSNAALVTVNAASDATFAAPQLLPRNGVDDIQISNIDVAFADDGRVVLASEARSGASPGNRHISVWQRSAAGTWGEGTTVSGSGFSYSFPRVAVDGNGSITVASQRLNGQVSNSGYNVEIVELIAGASTWNPPFTASPLSQYQFELDAAAGRDGTVGVVWGWGDGQTFAYGEPGVTYLSAYNVQVQTRSPGGTWFPVETVSPRSAVIPYPAAVAENGSVVVSWFESTQFNTPYRAGLASNGAATIPEAKLTVNSTADRPIQAGQTECRTGWFVSGAPECTLRAAIQAANAGSGTRIDFDIAGSGTPRIDVASDLPALGRANVTIDGTTQAGGWVEVVGTSARGLQLGAANAEVTGLAMAGFTEAALVLEGAVGAKVHGNRIGTDATGTTYRETGGGIAIGSAANAVIGGDAAAEGNQIVTEAGGTGIAFGAEPGRSVAGLVVRNNLIGANAAGSTALGPGPSIGIVGASSANAKVTIADNLVSGELAGIVVLGPGSADSTISSNTVGMNKAQTARLRTPLYGIRADGAPRTKITGNRVLAKGWDVVVSGSIQATGDETTFRLTPPSTGTVTGTVTGGGEQVSANRIGLLGDGTAATGNGSYGVYLWAGADKVVLDGNAIGGHTSAEVEAVRVKEPKLLRNRIGISPSGTATTGGSSGISLLGVTAAVIGDSNTSGNRIGGLSGPAIFLGSSSGSTGGAHTIVGNRIGLLDDGTTKASVSAGVVLSHGPKTTVGPDNVIANTIGAAVTLERRATDVTITGNRIGLDAFGTAKAQVGVGIQNGGPSTSDPIDLGLTISGNTVSGSKAAGILVDGPGIEVLLNRVGTGPTGTADLGNAGIGIAATGRDIGVRGNLVVHNDGRGVVAGGDGAVIADNQVGQTSASDADLGNASDGLTVSTGTKVKVTGNVVGGNDGNGLVLDSSATGEVRANRMGSNAGAGVLTQSTDVIIRDNRIGIPASGEAARPNAIGVDVVAGKALIKANRIANSTAEGVKVRAGTATLAANPIFANGAEGIGTTAPSRPTVSVAVRKGTDDSARTWIALAGPDEPGTLEVFGNVSCADPEGRVPLQTKTWKGGAKPLIATVRGNVTLLGITATFTDATGRTSAFSTCRAVDSTAADDDGDGIPTAVEALGPWSEAAASPAFAAVPTDAGTFVGLRTGTGSLRQVTPADSPAAARPVGLELPFGLVSFELHVPIPGQALAIDLLVDGNAGSAYWRYGPPDVGKPAQWYRFDYQAASDTGARRVTRTVSGQPYAGWELNLEDGARGDDDGTVNGVIVDPGGAGVGGVDDLSCPTAQGNARYVCRVYAYGLGRNPDPGGQAYWVRKLDAGTPRSQVMASFISTPESRRVVVQRLFSRYLKRAPDQSGLTYWADRLGRGTTPEALRINLLSSSEYRRISGGTNRDLAAALHLTVLGRAGTDQEVDAVTSILDAGQSQASVATALLRSTEGRGTIVAQAYQQYLERDPSTADRSYWTAQLAGGLSELTLFIKMSSTTEFANG